MDLHGGRRTLGHSTTVRRNAGVVQRVSPSNGRATREGVVYQFFTGTFGIDAFWRFSGLSRGLRLRLKPDVQTMNIQRATDIGLPSGGLPEAVLLSSLFSFQRSSLASQERHTRWPQTGLHLFRILDHFLLLDETLFDIIHNVHVRRN